MAVINLLLGRQQFRTTVGVLTLDAASEIVHTGESVPTTNPIESGSDIVDNIRVKNRRLSISGVVSQVPFALLRSAAIGGVSGIAASVGESVFNNQTALSTMMGSLAGLIENRNMEDRLYPRKAFEYLYELQNNRIPFNIQTRFQVYQNMIITTLSVPEDIRLGDSLRFSMQLEQIRLVNSEVIVVPESITNNKPGATANQNTGTKARNEATEQGSSLARRIVDGIGDFF